MARARVPWYRKLAYSLLPLVVLLAVAEGGLTLAGWPPDPTVPFTHNEPFWTIDPDLRDAPTPHRELGVTFPVSSNADSLRAPLVAREKRPGVQRVMALGCSTTFGWGVADAESYPARLQAHLGRPDVEVINGGQPGYTSFQGRWLWDRTLRHYEPDLVFIGYIVQDARMAAYTDKSQAILQGDARFLKDNFLYRWRAYLFLRDRIGAIQLQAKERPEGGESGVFRVPPEDYADNLRALIKGVRAAGGTPVLFGYPLERSGYTEQHRRILAAAAEVEGTLLFDPQPRMEEATRSGEYYFPQDRGHANAAGNDLIARWVAEWIAQQGLLGAGGAP